MEETTKSIDVFLKEFVADGKVDYNRIEKNQSALNSLISQIGSTTYLTSNDEREKTYLINLYNVFVIKQVVDHYPIDSPLSISNFFLERKFQVNGQIVNLDQLEKEIIFSKYPDPRLHFALVCGAKGCPKLKSEAYNPIELEKELDEQVKSTLNDPAFFQFDRDNGKVKISRIFDWYSNDFGQSNEERVEFINKYLEVDIPQNSSLSFMKYDWSLNNIEESIDETQEISNLQLFTPSALFNKGEFEVNVFNSIYSQQSVRNENGELVDLRQTQNFFTSTIMMTTGLSKKSRLNIGLDLFFTKARTVMRDASAFDVFNNTDAIFNKSLFTYIAPRIKFVPFNKAPRLSIQSSVWIPLSDKLESEGFVAHNRYTWFTQLFFDKDIGNDFQLFLEADLLYRFGRNESQMSDFFRTPLSAFLSYFPSPKSTLFAFAQYSPRFETTEMNMMEEFGLTQWFTQFGLGGKYQITDALGIEVSYSDFALSKSEGAGYTVNFGIRYIYR